MITTVYLIRHGESVGNSGRIWNPDDTPLSPTGIEQARRLAERLADEGPFDALYASDLVRTLQTAAVIGERLGLTPIPSSGFRELNTGDWRGRGYEELEAEAPGYRGRWIGAGGVERLPGEEGESTLDVRGRVLAAFEVIVAGHAGGRVAVVSHAWTLAILLAALHDFDHVDAFREQRFRLGNTSVSVVEVNEDGARACTLVNCTRHLPEAEADGLKTVLR